MIELEPHSAAWREWRRHGIGGSDAPIITGDDPFKSVLSLWLEKSGYLDAAERDSGDDDSPRWWGRKLESAVIERFELESDLFVIQRQLCIEHHLDRWRRATIDGLVLESKLAHPDNALGLFEGKTSSKTQDWADGVPLYVQIQVQHNLDVCELDHAWVAVLLTAPIVHFKLFEIERDEAITIPLRQMEERFWRRVLEHDAPSAQRADLDALKRAYAASTADTIELDDFSVGSPIPLLAEPVERVIEELVTARAAKAQIERRVETAEALLAAMLREHETGTIEGVPVIEWRRHEKTYFDIDALRAKHPRIADEFTSKRGYRQFTVPKQKRSGRREGDGG